jgi:hypothetical protein
VLFPSVHPLLKVIDKLFFGNGSNDLYRLVLKLSRDSEKPSSSNFSLQRRKSLLWRYWQMVRLPDCLDAFIAIWVLY